MTCKNPDHPHHVERAAKFAKHIAGSTRLHPAGCAHWAHKRLQRLFMVHWRTTTSDEVHGLPHLLENRKGEVRAIVRKIRASYINVSKIWIIRTWFYNVDAPACGLPSNQFNCLLMAKAAREQVRLVAATYVMTKQEEDSPWNGTQTYRR